MAGRILVLDDEENYAEMLQELLREHNYLVDMATRPDLAIEQLKKVPYDLVISDYKMPVMDGSDFLKHARELHPNLPCILVSGLMNAPELVKVANMGVTLVMEKPLDTAALLTHVSRFTTQISDQEKEDLLVKSASVVSVAADICPEAPTHVSAQCPVANAAMRKLWALSKSSNHCFILDHASGESGLALQDISTWRGESDATPRVLSFDDLVNGSHAKIASLLEDSGNSSLVRVPLSNIAQIDEAKTFLKRVVTGGAKLFFAFVFSSDLGALPFTAAAGNNGLILPPLKDRHSDVANYIQRALAVGSESSGDCAITNLSDEAVFALLDHQWSSYCEIVEVMQKLIEGSGNAPLSAEVVCANLDILLADIPDSAQRLSVLMSHSQQQYFEDQLKASTMSLVDFAKERGLGEHISSKDELSSLPLILEDLAQF